MQTTVTISLPAAQTKALREQARSRNLTEAELARDLVEKGLAQQPQWEDISDLKGCLNLPKKDNDPWRKKLRERNWRS